MNSLLKVLSRVFLVVFVLVSLLAVFQFLFQPQYSGIPGLPPPDPLAGFYISVLTSVISLLGFLVTATLSVRREKRESRESELTLKQKEIELERARLELEQLKKQLKKKNK
jgi:cell shape-determining protein MreC